MREKEAIMRIIKQILRTGILYVMVVMLACAAPLATVFAEDPENYTYNPETGAWDSSKWRFDAETGTYIPASTPKPTPPAPEPAQEAPAEETPATLGETTIANTGPDSNSSADTTTNASGTNNTTSNNTVTNTLNSDATSGDASVDVNSKAGDAGTGDASADATVINSVHSTVGGETSGVAHFTTDIYGDIHGDITLGPNLNGTTSATNTTNRDSTTTINNNNELTNNLNLNATSGDADVTRNTEAGNATSGNASAMANIVNLINTVIGANKSFVGTINVHGNLYGDILISPEFIPQLLASNDGSVTSSTDMPLSTNINDDTSIVNNVTLNATTGNASVEGNTDAGSATSGTAQTKLTVLNLTGHEVDAANCVLVFVNVKGKWVGMIVDAPGSTAAAIGSGVTKNTVSNSGTLDVNTNDKITNNINLAAQSGDANVKNNTKAGSATTGNASAVANIANISKTVINLSDWFMILYINIDGDWFGSFGINTENGDVIPLSGAATAGTGPASPSAPDLHFGFVPHAPSAQATQMIAQATQGNPPADETLPQDVQAVLASAKTSPAQPMLIPQTSSHGRGIDPLAIALMVSGGLIAISPLTLGLIRRRTALLTLLRP